MRASVCEPAQAALQELVFLKTSNGWTKSYGLACPNLRDDQEVRDKLRWFSPSPLAERGRGGEVVSGLTPPLTPPRLRGGEFKSVVLTIAGFDPTGGAGTIADTRTIESFGCTAVAAITSVTFQNAEKF